MNKRIKKKYSNRGKKLIQDLKIMMMLNGGPEIRAYSEIDIKAIRRYKRGNVRAYRILNLSKATKGD